ncbi:MAG: alanine racemase [Elusimicrobia bacterium]|nr:alanine racemase [Elusimicrobiota bacterium]
MRTLKRNQSKHSAPFYRPTWVEIHHGHLLENFRQISSLLSEKVSVLAVVKANAYGHGLVPVSQTLSHAGARFLGVTSLEESLELRRSGIKTPPLILGNIFPFSNLEQAIRNGVRLTVASLESARICHQFASKVGKKAYAHAKIDTGMNRIGVNVAHGLDLIRKIREYRNIHLEGVYTHFSGSAEDPKFTKFQIQTFTDLVKEIVRNGVQVPYVHCANSAALMKYPESRFSLVRPGISLYGYCPVSREKRIRLQEVLAWKSRIVFLKSVPANTPISYAGTFRTRRRSTIATAAFGYADGYRRSLSNKGQVLVRGKRVPVIGRVTMDMTMLDVTGLQEVNVGDEVVLIGKQGEENISAQEVAAWCQTSPYEIFCGIAARVPRIHVR